jgi:mediator of replication checkpoint protein 1
MASTPTSSRSVSGSPPGTPLSPRSKIQALLATVDSSDDDNSRQASRTKKRVSTSPNANTTARVVSANSDVDDEEDEDIVRPKGRLASRMQAETRVSEQENKEPTVDARERVRRLLNQASGLDAEDPTDVDMQDAESGEVEVDAMPSKPRRLQRRPAREATPEREPSIQISSPGLFVTPGREALPAVTDDEDDANDSDELPSLKNKSKLKELIERKRQERLAREAEEEKKMAERMARQADIAAELFSADDEDSGISDDEGGRRLTQEARPTRKAGKKAIEDINRETQRMARNMQLAHEAKTRKKITKASLFERFNFRVAGATKEPKVSSSSRPSSPVSAHQTEAEMKDNETPPSSPPQDNERTPAKESAARVRVLQEQQVDANAEEMLDLADVLDAAARRAEKGKSLAVDSPKKTSSEVKPKRQVRVVLPPQSVNMVTIDSDDDDLEITIPKKSKLDAMFDNAPREKTKQSKSFHALRCLANLGSPGKEARKKDKKSKLSGPELQALLLKRAREQAKQERERRLDMLRAKGVVIQTEEEREQEMQDVENIVARARQEAQEIMEREREAARKNKKSKSDDSEADPLAWDDSAEDDDYAGSEQEVEDVDIELSGSEEGEEGDGDDEEDDDEEASNTGNPLIDGEADEDSGSAESSEDEDIDLPTKIARRPKNQVRIVSDDDEDDVVESTPKPKHSMFKSPAPKTDSPAAPASVLRSATKPFIPGLPVNGPAGLGLTQIFAGTMDDSQMPLATSTFQSPMPDFDNLPDSNFSNLDTGAGDLILNSQPANTQVDRTQQETDITQGVQLHFSQSQMHGFDSLMRGETATQASDLIESTQDNGLQIYSPLLQRFVEAPTSTVETLLVDQDADEDLATASPLVRRGRLRRKIEVASASAEKEDDAKSSPAVEEQEEEDEFGFKTTAFSVMKDAAKKKKQKYFMDESEKKKSKAKEMVEDQAEESEDEYAGLGGADGEGSEDEDAASVHEMIDDAAGNDVDESKLAAFYA